MLTKRKNWFNFKYVSQATTDSSQSTGQCGAMNDVWPPFETYKKKNKREREREVFARVRLELKKGAFVIIIIILYKDCYLPFATRIQRQSYLN